MSDDDDPEIPAERDATPPIPLVRTDPPPGDPLYVGRDSASAGPSERPTALPIPLIKHEPPSDPLYAGRDSASAGPSDRGTALPIPLVRHAPAATEPAPGAAPLLRVRDLTVRFTADGETVQALDRVSFEVPRGAAVALVGESGSGKTVTALSILRLLPEPIGAVEAGSIELEGQDLLGLRERDMRAVRGGKIAMIFQEPMTSLNPVYTIGAQIAEAIRLHRRASRAEARRQAEEMLRRVGLPEPARRMDSYPHELSGGMRQRVMIAMALAPGPALLIADEPTTALDMTTQAQILELLDGLQAELGMSLLLIAHDLALVAELAGEIVVLYAGQVVERGPAGAVLSAPAHPYTRALLRSIPPTGPRAFRARGQRGRRLPTIGGAPPDLRAPPAGCRFADRCEEAFDRCHAEAPELLAVEADSAQHARCFLVAAGREEGAA